MERRRNRRVLKKKQIMPVPLAPLITAGAGLLGQGFNAWSTGNMNKKNRQWSEMMSERQRGYALKDYYMMLEHERDYNNPSAQMKRYEAAGLNPHLIYGQSNTGNVPAVRSGDIPSYRGEAPQVDMSFVGSALAQMYDFKLKDAQTNNIKAMIKVAGEEAALKAAQTAGVVAQTAKTQQDTALGKFNLEQAQRLAGVSLQTAEQQLKKLTEETESVTAGREVLLKRDEREAAMNASNLMVAAETILNLRAQRAKTDDERKEIQSRIRSIELDSDIKEFEKRLNQKGLSKSDPGWWRALRFLLEGNLLKKSFPPLGLD